MTLSHQVPSITLCQELKDHGYPQERYAAGGAYFVWWRTSAASPFQLLADSAADKGERLAAPTAAELGDLLPETLPRTGPLDCSKERGQWFVHYIAGPLVSADTEANARARMWLSLKADNRI